MPSREDFAKPLNKRGLVSGSRRFDPPQSIDNAREVPMVRFTVDSDRSEASSTPDMGCRDGVPGRVHERHKAVRHAGRVRGCQNAHARALLLPYVLSSCHEDEEIAFEAHLLACAPCFRDLKCLDRAGALIKEGMGASSSALLRARLALTGAHGVDHSPSHPRIVGGPTSNGHTRRKSAR